MTTHFSPYGFRRKALKIALALMAGLLLPAVGLALAYLLTDIPGPAGSGAFGATVTVLSDHNFVVADPSYDAGAVVDVGAVYLYDGATRQLISTLVGSQAYDQIGNDVIALSNGNYVVRSPSWDNGATSDAGAMTWCSGTTGCTGVVSVTNSLVGSQANDQVGNGGVTALSNGNYVVHSSSWDNGATSDAGAVTWCSGATGCTGAVSAANSLVGSQNDDQIGNDVITLTNGNYVVHSSSWDNGATSDAGVATWCSGTVGCTGVVSAANSLVGNTANDWVGVRVTALSNGNYVVYSPIWDNGATSDAGVVTWCSGTTGCTGVVSATNSLVGSQAYDQIGNDVIALSNGNYVVSTPWWANGAAFQSGAVTWCSGTVGCTGVVTTTNSLVGSQTSDQVGNLGVTALSNGNYVVRSPSWDNGATSNAGAATWCSGTTGCTGVVATSNSLVGSQANDAVGVRITALSNGNYVVYSPIWDNSATSDAGAATWCSGTTGCTGAVSAANSLAGSQTSDQVGIGGVTALSNGNYVVHSSSWDNGATSDAGAATWCSGTAGCTGAVSAANSLVGDQNDEAVGNGGVAALSNGNYVVGSYNWDNGVASDAGAATWCSGMTGCTGVVSAANSLVGSQVNDHVGNPGVTALNDGNYVVRSSSWANGATSGAGAVTWCSGTTGCTGVVSAANSLVGSRANDNVGYDGVTALNDGNYVVRSNNWDNGATSNAGAVTLGNGATGVAGPISATNSVRGTAANGGSSMVVTYDSVNGQLVVGRPADNIVSILGFFRIHLPLVRK